MGAGIRNWAINWIQGQCGTAKFEDESLLRGMSGRVLQALAMYVPMLPSTRVLLHRARGVRIEDNVFLGTEVFIDPVFPELVTIERDVSLAGRNMILTHSDPTLPIREQGLLPRVVRPVRIKRGAWVAVGAILLPGVTVGECSVVAAGAVVNKNIPDYVLAGGVPAKVLRPLTSSKPERKSAEKVPRG